MSERMILVVDDEKPVRDLFEKALTQKGYSVRCARDADEAMEIARRENIQVGFLDLKLPGTTGVELCRMIRKEKPLAVLHAVTGYTSLYDLLECREAGFDDYFTKPVELRSLWKAAEDAFEKIERWKRR
jgi:DNA-binding response OmpR family regulator